MNDVDESGAYSVGPDRLEQMFTLQAKLQRDTYGHELDTMSLVERVHYTRMNVLAALDELHEALNETGWKPWAKSSHMNEDAYFNELVDLWHFVMNLMLVAGGGPAHISRALYRGYMMKREKNVQRQADGYDGVSTKCAACKRALDDIAVACWKPESPNTLGWCDDRKVKVHISAY